MDDGVFLVVSRGLDARVPGDSPESLLLVRSTVHHPRHSGLDPESRTAGILNRVQDDVGGYPEVGV